MLHRLGGVLLGVAATLYISSCLLLLWGQTKLIFFPDSYIESTPRDYGLDYQDIWLRIGKDQVHGWWIPAAQTSAPTLLYLHGNGSNLGDLTQIAAILHELKVSVLLIDYRGYGKSSPVFPNEARVYQDAEAAWQYLTQSQKIKPQQIFVYGHSLGGAIAIELASRHSDLAGLITEGTFTSVRDLASLLPGLKMFPLSWLVTQRFDSITKLKSLQTPILILHGAGDRTIPPSMAKELYTAAPKPKYLTIFAEAEHNNLPESNLPQYLFTLQEFMHSASNPTK
jgi:uncharacterized protein